MTKKTPQNRNKMHKYEHLKNIKLKKKTTMFETSSFFQKKEEVSNDNLNAKLKQNSLEWTLEKYTVKKTQMFEISSFFQKKEEVSNDE